LGSSSHFNPTLPTFTELQRSERGLMASSVLKIIQVFLAASCWSVDALASLSVRAKASNTALLSFEAFVKLHNRAYVNASAEHALRRDLYMQRKATAEAHNRNANRLWTAGVNEFWDWTEGERQALRGWDGAARPAATSSSRSSSFTQVASSLIPEHLSAATAFLQRQRGLPKEKIWSGLSMARHVRNQGGCGSCWAIAAATVLEGHAEIHTGLKRSFSAQQIVACTPNPRHCGGDGGCQGATAELAMDWVMKHGCVEETQIPYLGKDSQCQLPRINGEQSSPIMAEGTAEGGAASFGMIGWETLPKNEYEPLIRALAEEGPVAVSVSAGTWFDYDSGVFDNCAKDAVIDHAVTAIGYGEDQESGSKYWLIQNSWGQDWGEDGHIRLLRHHGYGDDYCGMNNDPQKGVGCKGETEPVPVCGMCGVLFDSVVPHFRKH
jgi:cathepsin L